MTDPSDSPQADDDQPAPITIDRDALDSGEEGALAHLLAEEFRNETVSAEALRDLREGLLADDHPKRRVGRLQSTVSDLQAYVSRLDPILPDKNEPNENLQELLDRLGELDDTLTGIDADLDDTSDSSEDMARSIPAVGDDLEELADRRERLAATLSELDDTLDDIAEELDRLDDLDDRAETIEADLEAAAERCESLQAFNEDLQSALGNLDR